jgi:hydroxymethylglutaryl-CoA reductase
MKKEIRSDISGFYNLSMEERQRVVSELVDFSDEEKKDLKNLESFSAQQLDGLVENVIGSYQLPYGIGCNFKINNKDYLIPMVTEEPSVIAGASNAAKIARKLGGFKCEKVKSVMFSQIQITKINDMDHAKEQILAQKEHIIKLANKKDPLLVKLGGGAYDLELRELSTTRGQMLIVHLLVDVLDAMGANVVNTMAEAVASFIEKISGGKIYLRIISNLSSHRIARCKAVWDKDLMGGSDVIEGILDAHAFAEADPFRAATHNKGIMNGIIALTVATGNDTRAIEAGAHAYAALSGVYSPLSDFEIDSNGNLVGKLELPLALGIIGGLTKTHPMVKISLKILDVKSAEELSQVAVAVGLAQNVAALKALVTDGIQKGHMKLHKRKQNSVNNEMNIKKQ